MRGQAMQGSLLEFMLSIGDVGCYNIYPHTVHVVPLITAIGDALVAKGAQPSQGMIDAALSVGLHNLDGPERLERAFSWGAQSAWDPQRSLALCAAHSGWHSEAGGSCWDMLVKKGALGDPRVNFASCSFEMHPIARAAMNGDVETIKRAIKDGVELAWTDPDSNATLWHFACGLSIPVGKALLPGLIGNAPHLASVASTKKLEYARFHGEIDSLARQGQTGLHLACDGVRPLALQAALACNAQVDSLDSRGDTPLLILSRRWSAKAQLRAEPMVRALLGAGADASLKDKSGHTPAQNMASKGPMGALADLLALRPEDVGGDDDQAKKAFASLSERGAEGLARAENAAMTLVHDSTPDLAKAAPKKKRQAL
jgi:hypothetical protein